LFTVWLDLLLNWTGGNSQGKARITLYEGGVPLRGKQLSIPKFSINGHNNIKLRKAVIGGGRGVLQVGLRVCNSRAAED